LLRAIREQVFIIEQKVPKDMEWDDLDEGAWHALAWMPSPAGNDDPVGCVRLLETGQIGRMAVLAGYRGGGIGASLLQSALDEARGRGMARVFLHAQTSALRFYARAGFKSYGPVYQEAGIPHQSMSLELSSSVDDHTR
ncbi:MAG: GNAT family N-acetyltransferase, partial [Gammaproteobacteria bacterium]